MLNLLIVFLFVFSQNLVANITFSQGKLEDAEAILVYTRYCRISEEEVSPKIILPALNHLPSCKIFVAKSIDSSVAETPVVCLPSPACRLSPMNRFGPRPFAISPMKASERSASLTPSLMSASLMSASFSSLSPSPVRSEDSSVHGLLLCDIGQKSILLKLLYGDSQNIKEELIIEAFKNFRATIPYIYTCYILINPSLDKINRNFLISIGFKDTHKKNTNGFKLYCCENIAEALARLEACRAGHS